MALTLFEQGPVAAWQALKAELTGLQQQALDYAKEAALDVAQTAVPRFLAKLVVPGGAFLSVAEGLYDTIMTFVEKGKQIWAAGKAFLDSVQAIAAGQLDPAANRVEGTLVKILHVALSFLGRWLGVDALPKKLQAGLEKLTQPVTQGVDKLLDKLAEKAGPAWAKLQAGVGAAIDISNAVVTSRVNLGN